MQTLPRGPDAPCKRSRELQQRSVHGFQARALGAAWACALCLLWRPPGTRVGEGDNFLLTIAASPCWYVRIPLPTSRQSELVHTCFI